MNKAIFWLFLIAALFVAVPAHADGDWESSPYNWKNSPINWENSPTNWRNSPSNYKNSRMNPNRQGVYDTDGRSSGYTVPRSDGGVNIFSDDGERVGYIPSRRK